MRPIGLLLCLLAFVVAGCGGGARRASTTLGAWRHLARTWAQKADAVSREAAAGNSCAASQAADSLQSDVNGRLSSVPLRYRTVLLRAVDHLASGITCTPETVTVVTTAPASPPHGPKPPPHGPKPPPHGPGPPGHHRHGHDHGDGGNQGGDGG